MTKKETEPFPTQLYSGALHKSYQYYVKANPCSDLDSLESSKNKKMCMHLELQYFVDMPQMYDLGAIAKSKKLFTFEVTPDAKVEVNDNELSISNEQGGMWYKFEEKLEKGKSLLWIKVNYISSETPLSADLVLNITDPTKVKNIYFVDEVSESSENAWEDILKDLRMK